MPFRVQRVNMSTNRLRWFELNRQSHSTTREKWLQCCRQQYDNFWWVYKRLRELSQCSDQTAEVYETHQRQPRFDNTFDNCRYERKEATDRAVTGQLSFVLQTRFINGRRNICNKACSCGTICEQKTYVDMLGLWPHLTAIILTLVLYVKPTLMP